MSLARLKNFVESLLPDGPFWRDAAAARFVAALASAWYPLAEFLDNLPAGIDPATADRRVLLQWWQYLRAECLATPVDTEVLRETVIRLLAADAVDTPAGLRAMVQAFLPMVDVEDALSVSTLPASLPVALEATGRILQVWHSPLIYPAELVRCVVQRYQRAGDALRLIIPTSQFQMTGTNAGQVGIFWQYQRDSDLHAELYDDTNALFASEDLAVSESASLLASTLFSLPALSDIAGFRIELAFRRDGILTHMDTFEVV